ncbi:MAG: nuclear transport factor 2 family protein [Gemmatimonadales bacterium]|nr:nuclear transport factor 2 family protein [Gemmatimonadales bacterium]
MPTRMPMLILASGLVLAACAPEPAPAPDTSAADATAIRAEIDQFVAAWNVADNAAIGPLMATDVLLMQPDGPVQGRDAVLADIAEAYDVGMMRQSAVTDEVIVMGDYAYARGTWNLDPTPAAGEDAPAANGQWTVLLARGADGGWQFSRWMWNQPPDQVPYDE